MAAGGAAAVPLARALQPTVMQLARLVAEVKDTVVQPARLYWVGEWGSLPIKLTGVGQAPKAWAVAGVEDTYEHALLVGGGAVGARDVVAAVEAMGKGMDRVSAVVLAPPAAKADTSVAGVLASVGTTRADLGVALLGVDPPRACGWGGEGEGARPPKGGRVETGSFTLPWGGCGTAPWAGDDWRPTRCPLAKRLARVGGRVWAGPASPLGPVVAATAGRTVHSAPIAIPACQLLSAGLPPVPPGATRHAPCTYPCR